MDRRPCAAGEEGRRLAWTPCWFREQPGRQRLRPSDRRAVHRRRPATRWRCCGSRTRRRAGAARPPATTAPTRSAPLRDDCARSRSSSRRGRASRSTATRCAGRSGACASASPSARAWCCTRSPTTTRAAGARCCIAPPIAELVIPYGDPEPGRLPHERLRHRRVRHRPDDELAGAGLRLPRRDPLPGRDCARQRRRADRDPQRDLHARGGRRPALEALSTGRPQDSEVRRSRRFVDLLDHHRGELRVRLLLVPVSGRHDRDRGQADWDRADLGRAIRARGRAYGRLVSPRAVGAEPPALLLRPPGHGRGRLRQRPPRGAHRGGAGRPREPLRQRLPRRRHAAAKRARGPAGDRPAQRPVLADLEPRARATWWAIRSPTS